MRKHFLYANIIFILFFTATNIWAAEVSVFERTYVRETGSPVTETDTFPGINGLATIRVTNGGLADTESEMVSSSEIVLNGEVILDESNFNQNVDLIEVEKNLYGGINTIDVTLNGKPGGTLTVQVFAEAGNVDFDGDGFTGNDGDCDDDDTSINPDALEVCDEVDNNCDGQIDESVQTTYYEDADGDGYGNPNATTGACEQPTGYVSDNTDCNDNDSNERPDQTWYKDEDGDGYSDGTIDTTSCARPIGYKTTVELASISGDCNDNDASINPDALEVCDGVDNNCNGQTDEDVKTIFYEDTDGDGYGNPNVTTAACVQPSGYVLDNTDCNDNDSSEHPDQTWYKDEDGDGYSDGTIDTTSCTRPIGYKTDTELTAASGDCDDNDATVNPEATETPYDGIDQDCSGSDLVDVDVDGHVAVQAGGDDCNDDDPNVHPGATDIPDNGIDEDCDGLDIITVPDVVGTVQADAEAAIVAANLAVGTISTENSDTVPEDNVISQDPASGTSIPEGSSIDLVVSLGSSGPQLSSLEIFPDALTLTADGETHQLSVTGAYTDGSTKDITSSAEGTTYVTGDANIIDITPEGLATAVNNGTTTITVNNDTISSQINTTIDIQTTPPYDPTAYIQGKITDYETGLPIAGAGIEELTLGTTINTDANGNFTYPVPEGGKYIIFIEKQGYVTAKKEVVVDSGKNTSIEESLTLYETYTTHIDAALGGIATNAAGDIEMNFPPGALPYDIDISATRLEKEGYPVPLMKGQEFVDSVQFNPEHIDFNQDVTVRFSNKWGFAPSTEIPFAFGMHDAHDPIPEFPYIDPGMGQVTADGQWIEIILSHFSCPSLVLPSCNSGSEGDVATGGQQNPDCTGGDEGDDTCETGIVGASTIFENTGVLQIQHDMVPYKALGVSNGLSLKYRSDAANMGSVLGLQTHNNLDPADIPAQMTFKIDIEGVQNETHFTGESGDFAMAYYFDGKDAQGETLKTGAYDVIYEISNDYQKYFYTTDSFGGQPQTSTGVSIPEFTSYTNTTERNLIINNQIDSIFGAGWSLSGVDKLYPDPEDPDSALLVQGNGRTIYHTKSDSRTKLVTLATGLNYPTGIVYDRQGDMFVADRNNGNVLRIATSGNITTELTVSQPNGLTIAVNDDLYIATKGGDIYKIDASTNTSSLYVTLPSVVSQSVQDIEIDSQGNLYVYDTGGNHYLYKIDTAKQITTLIEGNSKLLVSSMAISPDDELYLTYNNAGFEECAFSWIARYTVDGILINFSDRLNSPAGITFDPDGTMYVVDRECGEQEYKVYTIDKFGARRLYNDTPVGLDPNFALAQLTHDIAWSPDGLAITGTLDNTVNRFKMEGLTPPRGVYSTLIQNADGSYTRTLKSGTTFEFDSNGYQTSRTDRNGNTTDYTYDSGGKLKTITDPTGQITTFNYNNGRIRSITDSVGRTTIFQHDADGNLISITDPDNSITTYTYDTKHLVTSKKVPTGETYSYEYDNYDRIVKSTSPTGETRQYKSGKMAVIINDIPAGEGTVDNPAKLKSISELVNTYTDSEGNAAKTTVDIDGDVQEKTDPLGRTTSFERDTDRNITRITRPNGEVETMTYDENGNLLTITTESTGGTTTFTYEPVFNNITSITGPKNNTTAMEYDSEGNLTKIIGPLNNETAMAYDGRGLLTSTTDALNNSAIFTYDGPGNLSSATDPLGNTTIFTYGAAGNLETATDAGLKTTSYEYDIVNNLTRTTATDNTETSFTYNSGERCQPCGATSGGDLLTSITDANNKTTTFDYNEIGQLSTTTNPAGLVTAYTYDTDRKLISKTDPNLQASTYQYDAAGQLIQKDLPSDTVKYTYNSSGSPTSVEDIDSLVLMDYDLQNRLIFENATDNPGAYTITLDMTIEADNHVLDGRDITVDGATLTLNGDHTFNNLTLTNIATLTHSTATTTEEYTLNIDITGVLAIDATSSIDVTEKGYLGGRRDDNTSTYGRTLENAKGSYANSAGSYGGLGGEYSGNVVNDVYGSIVNPDELGSGGGSGSPPSSGGNGGGLVRITAVEMALDGSIMANGGNGSDSYNNGGGSGGGVYIETGTLRGTGTITADGGKDSTAYPYTTGGGGGRIAIYYDDISGFDTANITAYGGIGNTANGGAGTIYLKTSTQTYGDLIVDNNNIATVGYSTPLVSVGTGTSTDLTADALTDDVRNWGTDELAGLLYLNPNTGQDNVFRILNNDATTITTDLNDGDMTAVAVIGDIYSGKYIMDHLYIRGGARIETEDDIEVVDPVTDIINNTFEIDGTLKANSLGIGTIPLIINNGGLFVDVIITPGEIDSITLINSSVETSTPLSLNGLDLDNSDAAIYNDVTVAAMTIGNNSNMTVYGNLDVSSVLIDNNSELSVGGILQADDISITNSSIITHPVSTTTEEYSLEVTVTNTLTIDSSSSIDVTEKGYLGGRRDDNTSTYGRTIGNAKGSYANSAGSYGGLGGEYSGHVVYAVYGSIVNPDELGSGGGSGTVSSSGGNGGGLVRITAVEMALDGSIMANGGNGSDSYNNGGGSGGGVYVETGTLSGTGVITADGGKDSTAYPYTTGGGGGRIAIYYDDISGFDTANITAYGGIGNTANGGAGTIYLKTSTQTYGDLIVDNNNIATVGYSTPLVSVGTGASTGLTADILTDDTRSWRTDDLAGIYLNPNTDQGNVMKIIGNDATTITTDLNDGDMTAVAVIGDTYRGKHILDHLYIRGGARVETEDDIDVIDPVTDTLNNTFEIDGTLKANSLGIGTIPLIISNGGLFVDNIITPGGIDSITLTNATIETSTPLNLNDLDLDNSNATIYNGVTTTTMTIDNNSELSVTGTIQADNISVENNSLLTHPVSTLTEVYGLNINTTTLAVDTTSSIDVTEKGYLGGRRDDNTSTYGRTLENAKGSYANSAGSYGGLGGEYSGHVVIAVYGSIVNPDELGSGGGSGSPPSSGGNGGGLVRITAVEITLDGSIRANGGNGSDSYNNGGGSGGGVYVETGTLSGTGLITANGGKYSTVYSYTTGGGGGRIAIYYDVISGFDTASITAYGGIGSTANGGAGTIYLKSSAQTYGDLIVDNNNIGTSDYSTPLASVGTGTSTGLTADTLTDDTRSWRTDDITGIYLNPNINQGGTPVVFEILSNDSASITIDNTINYLTDVAVTGDTYIGELYIDNLTIINSAKVETLDRVYYNSLDITGGELKAENDLQVGKLKEDVNGHSSVVSKQETEAKVEVEPENPESEILSSVVLLSPKATDGQRTDVNLPERQGQAGRKSIFLASLSPVSTNDASIMTDAGVGGKLETGDSKLVTRNSKPPTRNSKLVTQMAKPGGQSNLQSSPIRSYLPTGQAIDTLQSTTDPETSTENNHQSTIVNSKSASGVDPQYEYDLNGNRASMIGPSGETWTYDYDAADRLTKITNPDGKVTILTYDDLERRSSVTYANGVVTSYNYDAASRLTSMSTDIGATNISSYTYTYDKVGNRLSMTDNDGTHNYVYSDVYRLVSATHPQIYNPDESFTYDPVGNRLTSHLSSAYVYDNLNRLLEDDQYTYTYDDNGNLLSKVDKVSSDTTTYQYDDEDRLIQVETPTDIVEYKYDGFGRRIAKTVTGVVTKYVYDREDILFELDENNQIKARYTHGPKIDEPISVDKDTNGDGVFDVTYYYHKDVLGSVTAMTDGAGSVVQTYEYDSFGETIQETGSVDNAYTYTGREWDVEAGLYFYRARYYDAGIGRFINADPIGFNGSNINFYVYVDNNPVNWIDPFGLKKCDDDHCWDEFVECLAREAALSEEQIKACSVICGLAVVTTGVANPYAVYAWGACGVCAGGVIGKTINCYREACR